VTRDAASRGGPAGGARVVRIAGALAEVRPMGDASLYELVRVGDAGLMGEVVQLMGDTAMLQIYEDTAGLRVGEVVHRSGGSLTVRLGPGLLGAVLDGVGRPLGRLGRESAFLHPGVDAPTLDPSTRWRFEPAVRPGQEVAAGDVLGTVAEAGAVRHVVMAPPDAAAGVVVEIAEGEHTVDDVVCRLRDGRTFGLAQDWPMRVPRPAQRRLPGDRPFITGQRILDFLFPAAEGGSVAVPGGFGTGKTVLEQSLARFADADVVVYVGCGERGNEMAELLQEIRGLEDPRTGGSILDRTVLVVNTSNMPVAAREASIYVGMTIGEFYRDMGLRVAVLADSISRWGEALREMGARLQEMPGEEGYPTYLGNRLGKVYERAGRVATLGRPSREAALTLIAAVSPPGGDLSEPVTQATLRVTGALWALDAGLAHQRHFPAIDWETSYSLNVETASAWFAAHAGTEWPELRRATLELLQQERELRDIAGLIGLDALQERERLVLETARIVREVVLAQSAFDPNDADSPVEKTFLLVRMSHALHRAARACLEGGVPFDELRLERARQALTALRDAPAAEREARVADVEAALPRVSAGAT
jgi:V/A-type H+/Na+-transporting ATPase subunit A